MTHPIVKPGFRHKTDLDGMLEDIVKAAEIAEVPYNKENIWRVLIAYRDFYSGTSVTFTTTTKPKEERGLAVRYVELKVPHDPYAIALENGLIIRRGYPIEDLYSEIKSIFPILGYGVDMDVQYGLIKIWTFLQIPQPINKAYQMSSLPASIRNHADYFSKYNLLDFSLFALDFRNLTTNLYFMVPEPGIYSPEKIAGIIGDVDLTVPSEELLMRCSKAATIYPTFSSDSDRIERICFGMVAYQPNEVPTHLHPVLEHFAEHAPFQSEKRRFIYSVTPSRRGEYIKIENDYTGSMIDQMMMGAHAGLVLNELKKRCEEEVIDGKKMARGSKWGPEICELFENIVANVPDVFRAMVKPMLHETAEKKCEVRSGSKINENDVIMALFDITPEPFIPDAIENLKNLGVDVEKYLKNHKS